MVFGMVPVIFPKEVWGMQVVLQLPGIIALWVALPFHQVLKFPTLSVALVASDGFYLIFLIALYQLGRWSQEVGSVLWGLLIPAQQQCMKHGVDIQLIGEL